MLYCGGCEGEVLAKQLANLGAKLIISARNEAELERVKSQLSGICEYWTVDYLFLILALSSTISLRFVFAGKHAPDGVKVLPLDLTSGEDALREIAQKADLCFPDSGVDYMIHNAAFERPVSEL